MKPGFAPYLIAYRGIFTFWIIAALLVACNPIQPALTASPPQATPSADSPVQEPTFQTTAPDEATLAFPPSASPAPAFTPTLEPIAAGGTPIPEEVIATMLAAHTTPTKAPSPTPSVPLSYLYISRPGHLSKVTSPFQFLAQVIPGPGGVVRIELIGEDGRALVRQIQRYNMPKGMRFGIGPEINFEIPGVSEAARLQVSVLDGFNRPVSTAAVRLILLSLGEDEINAQSDFQDPFFVTSPKVDTVVSGGTLTVTGQTRPVNANPIIFELINEQGQEIGSRQIAAPLSTDGSYQPFSADVPYTVSKLTRVRLVIRQTDEGIPGNIALSSLTLTLSP